MLNLVPADEEAVGETTDPKGRRVVLLDRVWQGKVLGDHPELTHHVADVLPAVATPDHVDRDPVYGERTRYHAREAGPSRWLLVVVSYEQEPARIVSAFGTRKDPRSWTA